MSDELLELIKDEVNIKEVVFDSKITNEVELDTNLTDELKEEGILRDLARQIKSMRKELGLTPSDSISIEMSYKIKDVRKFKKEIGAKEIKISSKDNIKGKEIKIGDETHIISVLKV
ncbi:MAG: DUF5915 domain-containing protein [Candidatus Nealsonbacteria bacterium]|nr:DUF5915 domain-containing protein [Candidatus Nealsonbacteria bacterium]